MPSWWWTFYALHMKIASLRITNIRLCAYVRIIYANFLELLSLFMFCATTARAHPLMRRAKHFSLAHHGESEQKEICSFRFQYLNAAMNNYTYHIYLLMPPRHAGLCFACSPLHGIRVRQPRTSASKRKSFSLDLLNSRFKYLMEYLSAKRIKSQCGSSHTCLCRRWV